MSGWACVRGQWRRTSPGEVRAAIADKVARDDAQRDRLLLEVELDVAAAGRGPCTRELRAADRKTLVRDRDGRIVAVVGTWGVGRDRVTEARTIYRERWTPAATRAA